MTETFLIMTYSYTYFLFRKIGDVNSNTYMIPRVDALNTPHEMNELTNI